MSADDLLQLQPSQLSSILGIGLEAAVMQELADHRPEVVLRILQVMIYSSRQIFLRQPQLLEAKKVHIHRVIGDASSWLQHTASLEQFEQKSHFLIGHLLLSVWVDYFHIWR